MESASAPSIKVVKVIVHSSTAEWVKKIASNRPAKAKPKDRFVSPKGNGDAALQAVLDPADSCDDITWEADGATITSPAVGNDKCTAKVSRGTSAKIPVRIKSGGDTLWEGVVWIVWANLSITNQEDPEVEATARGKTHRKVLIQQALDMRLETVNFEAEISPAEIITDDDRPVLDRGWRQGEVPGGNQKHVGNGRRLSGGVNYPWDMSRQIRARVINPHLYTKNDFGARDGTYYDNQPAPDSTPVLYPEGDEDVALVNPIGNDDANPFFQENNPYRATGRGTLTDSDSPSRGMYDSVGQDGHAIEQRLHFRQFARLKLDDTWYRISDPLLWKVHFKFVKVNGKWTKDNASEFATNNDGF